MMNSWTKLIFSDELEDPVSQLLSAQHSQLDAMDYYIFWSS